MVGRHHRLMDRSLSKPQMMKEVETWRAAVRGVAKTRTQPGD